MSEGDPSESNDDEQRVALFLKLFVQKQGDVYRYIRSLAPSKQDADDLFQRTSLVLWQKFDEQIDSNQFLPWSFTVAWLEVSNFYRTRGRERLSFSEDLLRQIAEAQSQQPRSSIPRVDALRTCLDSLGEFDRLLIKAIYFDQVQADEIASRTGRSIQTIYNRLSLLRKRLAECVRMRVETDHSMPSVES